MRSDRALRKKHLFTLGSRCILPKISPGVSETCPHLPRKTAHGATIATVLQQEGISYILVDQINAQFMLAHDPQGEQSRAYATLYNQFFPACGKLVYQDKRSLLYEFTCR